MSSNESVSVITSACERMKAQGWKEVISLIAVPNQIHWRKEDKDAVMIVTSLGLKFFKESSLDEILAQTEAAPVPVPRDEPQVVKFYRSIKMAGFHGVTREQARYIYTLNRGDIAVAFLRGGDDAVESLVKTVLARYELCENCKRPVDLIGPKHDEGLKTFAGKVCISCAADNGFQRCPRCVKYAVLEHEGLCVHCDNLGLAETETLRQSSKWRDKR